MIKKMWITTLAAAPLSLCLFASNAVQIASGTVEGVADQASGVRSFKGIPYAAPPIGALRWKRPQPVAKWTDVRQANKFGSRCMQGRVFGDMNFRDEGASEDCLYLNVWTPASASGAAKPGLPVMVWIYGGGFVGGAASEPRQDGGELAKKGVIVVSMNYRLGVFGFLALPALAAEAPDGASGNYGLLDQTAALQWVHDNIAAFGGDPENVTIFGESAGSYSVSFQMASPLAKGFFQKAIGESGSFFGSTALAVKTLAQSEEAGNQLMTALVVHSLEELRAKSADEILKASLNGNPFRFSQNIDGYFLPRDPEAIYAAGAQAHVPLLAGWNANEAGAPKADMTKAKFEAQAQQRYGANSGKLLKFYPASTDEQARESANALDGDQFIALSTWKWLEAHAKTGASPEYRYSFDLAPPQPEGKPSQGAYHSAEIEYVFEALPSKKLPWRKDDEKLSQIMASYWTNFAKTGNPNGQGLPNWPVYDAKDGFQVMHLSPEPHAVPDAQRARYQFLDSQNTHH